MDRRQDCAATRRSCERADAGPDSTTKHAVRASARKLLLQHSTFYVFGTEESYGYLPNDYVRDKDGNAACLMFAELCAWVKSRGITVPEYLDEIYLRYGFFLEGVINIYYEGATGARRSSASSRLTASNPPKAFGDVKVDEVPGFRPGEDRRRRR